MKTPRVAVSANEKEPAEATEGVIKYTCELVAPLRSIPNAAWRTLEAWRTILIGLDIVGQSESRYDGYGFGNLSIRAGNSFWITGTQTGHWETLTMEQYAEVVEADLHANRLTAAGAVRPSSEALTHAAIYAADAGVEAVFHAHSPDLFRAYDELRLPAIEADVEYGTPAMASATAKLLRTDGARPLIFATLGHEDGIFAAGADADAVGAALVARYADALKVTS